MQRIVGGKRYDTETATLVAHDRYWDGHNWQRKGRNTFLYRTPRGAFFVVVETAWQGERDTLEPVEIDDAIHLYEKSLPEHELSYEQAFPSVTVEDA